jgi:hypothetical protein
MRVLAWVLIIVAALAVAGCWMEPGHDTVRVDGTVHHYDLEGGFWAVRGDDSTTYDPMNGLTAEFQQEGLRVRLEGKIRKDMTSIHMVGPIVEVTSIRRL